MVTSPLRRILGSASTCAIIGAIVGCSAPEPPDVLLVTIDTLRADHVGSYGYTRDTTPTLDRLAGEGALFEIAYAPTGATSPSHASLLTSRHPLAHGLVRNGFPLRDSELTLAEILRREGWTTAAFVSSFPVSQRFGFGQGFDHFDDAFGRGEASVRKQTWEGADVGGGFDRDARHTTDAALAWLDGAPRDRPLFAWVHYFDPHSPYRPPRAYRNLFPAGSDETLPRAVSRYDAEIRFVDDQIARLLEGVGGRGGGRDLLVVITSDHGEGLKDHGWYQHNRFLYEEEVRVPLVLHGPGRVPPARIAEPAHLVDVAPTLLSLLGIRAPGLDGQDLTPWLEGAPPADPPRPVALQRPYYREGRGEWDQRGQEFGVRRGDWKYIEALEEGRRRLYHLADDPGETRDLAAEQPEIAAGLSLWLAGFRARESAKGPSREPAVRPEDVEALRALGYAEPAASSGSEAR